MLRLDAISCGYGAFRAVNALSLDIPKGEVFALIGANGAGKSSTIMAIAGHVRVFGGAILLDGKDITAMPARKRVGRGIAIAPEGRKLFPDLSVEENLTVGGYILSRERSDEQRGKVLELFPRLGERLGQAAGSLSGGEQQMLAIGRALMAEPKLLMVDEVSLGLMPKMIDICYQAIAALKADGMTILLVEQSTKRALDIADRVCVLESGRQVWAGSAEEARRDPDMIEAYLGLREEAAP
jgi:branched-chain amino acid transport system ATP-binding protein